MILLGNIKGKTALLARAMRATGALQLLNQISSSKLLVFNYHRIKANADDKTAFDDNVFGPDAETFRSQMQWLSKDADAISETDLINHIYKGTSLPKRAFMITFDDGYIDNYTLAKPVLNEFSIPAIYFIPTQAIEERRLGWWDEIMYLLKQTQKKELMFRGERVRISSPVDSTAGYFFQKMKLSSFTENQKLVDELAQACEVRLPTKELTSTELMNWDQIRDCHNSGITIGSHTVSHRVLGTLSLDEQKLELSESKAFLEKTLGFKIRSFAYPVGGYEHFNTQTMQLVSNVGYDLAFSFNTGFNVNGLMDPTDIKRVCFSDDPAIYKAMLEYPNIFAKRGCALAYPQPKSL